MTTLTRYSVVCRSTLDGDTLVGHAAVFGQMAKVPGGYEQLARSAFDGVLDRSDTDVVALVEHDPGRLLGRQSSGTLRLKVDGEGLAFEVDLPDTQDGAYVRSLAGRGDLVGASFGFIPGDDGTWTRNKDGSQLHTINSIAYLRDVATVTLPAYSGAGVALRSYSFDLPSGRSQMAQARARVLLKGKATT
jgi:HK97 family phage prohead protease